MKHLFISVLLLATIFVSAQTISQPITNEYCPNQEYTFNVTGLPNRYNSIEVSPGIVITSNPVTTSDDGKNITFKAKFGDVVGAQTFTINTSGSSPTPFIYRKVKTLINSYKNGTGSPASITVPICQTTPISVSLSGQYVDASTNPVTYFGTITKFEYIIPAGWYLNSTLSTGSDPIVATGTVTLVPDASTGGGGKIQYRALAECPNTFSNTTPYYINISRPNPVYTITPSTVPITCGTAFTKTFTVSTTNSVSCSVSYEWNLGANNGWLYNGTSAPATITTATNTLTLTYAGGGALPASVFVTPILNGASLPQLQCTTSLTQFTSTATISGVSSYCTTQSSSIFTINAGANNSVTWSSSNPAIASVSNQTNTQVTVTSVTQGLFNVNATITNQCGQTVPKTSQPITVGTPMPLIDGFYCYSESAPCNLNVPASNNYLMFSLSAPTGTYVPSESDWQWEKVTGNFYFLDNGQYTATSTTGHQCNIYLTGANPTDNPLQLRCRVRNQCGWGNWRYYTWNDGTTTVVTPPPPPDKYYKVYPNPSGGYSASISLLDPAIVPPTSGPVVIKLYTIYGQLLSTTNMTTISSGTVYIYSYPYNTMYIIISFGTHNESHTIVKY